MKHQQIIAQLTVNGELFKFLFKNLSDEQARWKLVPSHDIANPQMLDQRQRWCGVHLEAGVQMAGLAPQRRL